MYRTGAGASRQILDQLTTHRAYLLTRCDELAAEVERLRKFEPQEGEGDWYCGNCGTALHASRVTFDERCDSCYHPVEWIPVPKLPVIDQQAARIAELEGAIAETLRRENTMDGHTIGWLLEPLEGQK